MTKLSLARKHISNAEFIEAESLYSEILEEDAQNLEALGNLGVVLKALGRYDEALHSYTKALDIDAKHTVAYINRANLLKSLNRREEAEQDYLNIVSYDPKNAEAFNALGSLFEDKNETVKALAYYQKAIAVDSSFYKAYNNCAVALYTQGKYQEAIAYFEQTIKLNPKYSEAYSNLGAVLAKLEQYTQAITFYQKAIELNPSYAGAYTNLGNALNKLGEYEQAIYFHLRAINLNPNAANHYANLGSAYKNIGRFNRAQKMYEKAIELEPSHVNAHFDLSTVLLQTGSFKEGWKEYEWRFKKEQMLGHIKKYENIFSSPLYTGEDLENKTILLHAEQGFGDSLMMIRYVCLVKEKGAKVVLYLRAGLEDLFKSIDSVDAVYVRDDELPFFDFHLPIMSLASCFDANLQRLEVNYPYLKAPVTKNLQSKKLKIGIVWGASETGESYKNKVFSLDKFAPLFSNDQVKLYSLQVGKDADVLKVEPYKSAIVDLCDKIDNFSDTASLIQELDLVISSDTSVAHLAGALGKEVWILLQKVPDWRWGVSGEKSIWYPSARLFWQDSLGDWDGVFNKVFKAIQERV